MTDDEKNALRRAVANRQPIGHLLGRPEKLAALVTATKRAAPCVHLGPEVRRVDCQSCQGTVRLKVFGCEVHGECLARPVKSLPELAACRCANYCAGNETGDR